MKKFSLFLFVLFGFVSLFFIGGVVDVHAFPLVDGQTCTVVDFDDPTGHPDQCECPSATPAWIASGSLCTSDPVITCDFNGNAINEGQSITAYAVSSTPYGAMLMCVDQSETRTCNDVAGTGVLSGSYTFGSCTDESPSNCDFNGTVVVHGGSTTGYQDSTVPSGSSCVSEQRSCADGVLDGSYAYTSCAVSSPVTGSSDCTLPRGGTIVSGDTVTAYQASSVACGSTCISEVRTCNSGSLDGSYTNQFCSVSSCGGGGGGGGGGSSTPTCELEDLICVDGIYEEADGVNCRYGELGDECEISEESSTGSNDYGDLYDFTRIGDISNSLYGAELNLAYLYAYNMGITSMDNIIDANMEGNLIRSHMAKMLVERAINVRGLEANTEITCDFDDIASLQGQDLYDFVIQSCQMGLMGLDSNGNPSDSFRPGELVTRAQFGTVLSRAIWGEYYNGGTPYYADHLDVLNTVEIMNSISDPYMFELRGYVMLMLLRANQLLVQ